MSEQNNNEMQSQPTVTYVDKNPALPRLWWGMGVGIAVAILFAVSGIVCGTGVLYSLIAALFFYTFTADLFFEGSGTRSVVCWMATRSIAFPGLIWEFSIDGFLWLIGMKLLFWVVGLLFGILCAIVGVIVAVIISPVCYIVSLVEYISENKA